MSHRHLKRSQSEFHSWIYLGKNVKYDKINQKFSFSRNLPQTSDADVDVYMNYTSSTQPYTDLNPSNLTGEDFYSSLS